MLRKGIKRSLLFFLANCVDVCEDFSVKSFYRSFYLFGGYKPETITEKLSRMSKVGEIEKKIVNGKAVFVITAKGEKLMDENIPLQRLEKMKWDGWWRIVIFDIEEKNKYLRDRVRKKLQNLGFGKWQESVYVSPHALADEINQYFEEKELYPSCICLEARETGNKDNREFAEQIFGLNQINGEYKKLEEEVSALILQIKVKRPDTSLLMKMLHELLEIYESIILRDPFLPRELGSGVSYKDKAGKSIAELAKYIAKTL